HAVDDEGVGRGDRHPERAFGDEIDAGLDHGPARRERLVDGLVLEQGDLAHGASACPGRASPPARAARYSSSETTLAGKRGSAAGAACARWPSCSEAVSRYSAVALARLALATVHKMAASPSTPSGAGPTARTAMPSRSSKVRRAASSLRVSMTASP